MLVIIGYNYKRGRKERSGDYRNTKLYQQRFPFRRKVTCNEEFIAQAGLNDESIQKAVISALDTDYGIKLEIRGEVDATPPPKIDIVLPKNDIVESTLEAATDGTFYEKVEEIDKVLDSTNKIEGEE